MKHAQCDRTRSVCEWRQYASRASRVASRLAAKLLTWSQQQRSHCRRERWAHISDTVRILWQDVFGCKTMRMPITGSVNTNISPHFRYNDCLLYGVPKRNRTFEHRSYCYCAASSLLCWGLTLKSRGGRTNWLMGRKIVTFDWIDQSRSSCWPNS